MTVSHMTVSHKYICHMCETVSRESYATLPRGGDTRAMQLSLPLSRLLYGFHARTQNSRVDVVRETRTANEREGGRYPRDDVCRWKHTATLPPSVSTQSSVCCSVLQCVAVC